MSLTKYPVGSVRELWSVSAPLLLSSFSLLAMVFVDRVFLARYSPAAMSAAVTAGTASWAVFGSLVILTSMSEVFVAQYNGAGQHARIGRPVWQMLWLSVASIVVLVPLALWGGKVLFMDESLQEQQNLYWKWIMLLGWGFPLQGALAAFYVGRGKTQIVMWLAVIANVANVLLDWALIFGIEGWFPAQGVRGAAIATCSGNFIQVIVLLILFFRPRFQSVYGTGQCRIHFGELRKVLKVGAPQATMFFVETMGWALFYLMIAHVGPEQIFVAGIAQSVLILFFFTAEGVGRGAAAITGNLIGAGKGEEAFRVFRAGLKFHLGIFVVVSLFFVVYPQWFIDLFLSDSTFALSEHGALGPLNREIAEKALRITLQLCLFYLLFECIRVVDIGDLVFSRGYTVSIDSRHRHYPPIFARPHVCICRVDAPRGDHRVCCCDWVCVSDQHSLFVAVLWTQMAEDQPPGINGGKNLRPFRFGRSCGFLRPLKVCA